jgi:hypothetical protein
MNWVAAVQLAELKRGRTNTSYRAEILCFSQERRSTMAGNSEVQPIPAITRRNKTVAQCINSTLPCKAVVPIHRL